VGESVAASERRQRRVASIDRGGIGEWSVRARPAGRDRDARADTGPARGGARRVSDRRRHAKVGRRRGGWAGRGTGLDAHRGGRDGGDGCGRGALARIALAVGVHVRNGTGSDTSGSRRQRGRRALAAWEALRKGGIYHGTGSSLPEDWASGDVQSSAHIPGGDPDGEPVEREPEPEASEPEAVASEPKPPVECTSFAIHAGGRIMAGQTNDEPCHLFDGGNADVVVRLEDTASASDARLPIVLTVTHPGMPAFKGMTSARA
jgi:hypothetical protein